MGRTYKHGQRWKKDRRDKTFQKSKKFKEFQHEKHQHKSVEIPPVEIEEDYGDTDDTNNS